MLHTWFDTAAEFKRHLQILGKKFTVSGDLARDIARQGDDNPDEAMVQAVTEASIQVVKQAKQAKAKAVMAKARAAMDANKVKRASRRVVKF